ncbi:MAG: hypothetical protein IT210_15460 [Armatimonadetes bacterium]|nr:hypothetical protein [Armatimonadota bacterium]
MSENRTSSIGNRRADQVPLRLDVPDRRFQNAFFCQLAHLTIYSVGDAPRISPVTYPLWWARDGSYIVVALDRGGYHDFAGRACRDAVRVNAMTGFGGEADAPGELAWMLSEHYLLTGSLEYLKVVFPFLKRKVALLMEMRRTDRPLRQPYEFVVHEHALRPDSDLLCRPARNGLAMRRMDHLFPVYWVNAFAYIGLTRTALCARALGEDGSLYEAEAIAL